MRKYFGKPLNLTQSSTIKDKAIARQLFPLPSGTLHSKEGVRQSKLYGLQNEDNMMGITAGSNTMFSAASYSIFLQKYLSGEYKCDQEKINKIMNPIDGDKKAGVWKTNIKGYAYGLGSWVFHQMYNEHGKKRYKYLAHSIGAQGAVPVWGKTVNNKKFWMYIGRYGDKSVSDKVVLLESGLIGKVSGFIEKHGHKISPIDRESLCEPKTLPNDVKVTRCMPGYAHPTRHQSGGVVVPADVEQQYFAEYIVENLLTPVADMQNLNTISPAHRKRATGWVKMLADDTRKTNELPVAEGEKQVDLKQQTTVNRVRAS